MYSGIYQMEEAGVPMEGQKQVVDQREEPQEVWVVCVPLASVHESPELVDLDQPVKQIKCHQ